jgi:hypothetical protein
LHRAPDFAPINANVCRRIDADPNCVAIDIHQHDFDIERRDNDAIPDLAAKPQHFSDSFREAGGIPLPPAG